MLKLYAKLSHDIGSTVTWFAGFDILLYAVEYSHTDCLELQFLETE